MPVNTTVYNQLLHEFDSKKVQLVAVSKTKPVEDILKLYQLGQRIFGENYVRELIDKQAQLPQDIQWHFIGHLQSNKVKQIASFVHLIHGVDSWKLLEEINKQAIKNGRVIDCLLQVHIAEEESKFGFDITELIELKTLPVLSHIRIRGLMGMASFSENVNQIHTEFQNLALLFNKWKVQFDAIEILSMGMSSDYKIAIENGSNMVRIGSMLFGQR